MPIVTFLIGIVILFVVLKVLSLPFKIIVKFLINALVGGIVLYVLSMFGIGLTITWVSALLVGALGIPGVIIVAILQFVLHLI